MNIHNKNNVLIIVPVFNEQSNISYILDDLSKIDYDVVFIDDKSADNTVEMLENAGQKIVPLPVNLGIGGCIQTGYKYAFENDYDIVIQYDGDGQHMAEFIPDIIEKIESGCDYVIGSRYIKTNDGFQSSKLRRVGIKLLSLLISIISGKKVLDVTSGFRGCNKGLIKAFCKYYPKDYPEPEVAGALAKQGYKIAEIPVEMRERNGGNSSIKPISSIYYMIKVAFSIMVMSHSYSKEK